MWRALLVICILLAAMTFWLMPQREQAAVEQRDDVYRFIETRCWFRIPHQQDIVCGELLTPLSAGNFTLPVVRIRDHSAEHRSDPVIYLPGGPGGSAGLSEEGIHHWINWLAYAQLGRDLILMEPRGVGLSQPRLACAAYDQLSLKLLKQNASLQQELAESYALLEQCFAQRKTSGQQAGYYTTAHNAADVQALIGLFAEKNPAEQAWNLLGVSYGSRLAMVTAQDFPLVRSVILDSPYPPPYGGLHGWPALFERSLQRFFQWCAATTSCQGESAHPPSIERLFLALKSLRAQPVTLTIRRWDGEPPIDLVLNDHRFLSAIFAALYSVYDRDKIVPAIEAIIQYQSDYFIENVDTTEIRSEGRLENQLEGRTQRRMAGIREDRRAALEALVEPFINNVFTEDFNSLVFFAVDCHDHPVLPEADYLQQIEKHPLFADYMRDLWRYQTCHFLSPADAATIQLDDLPQQPTLLLAGTLDPITPPEWAQELHRQWSNSQLIMRDDIGHAVISSDACVHRHLRQFLDAPHQPLELRCDDH